MTCNHSKKYFDAYVDGELEASMMLEIEHHMSECSDCGARVFLGRRMKNELSKLGRVAAPAGLKQRIEQRMRFRRRAQVVGWIAAVPLAAAASLALILNIGQFGEPAQQPMAEVVEDVVQRHVRELPMEVTGSNPEQAATWFRGKVDFPVRAPNLKLTNASYGNTSFNGARLSNVREHQAAHMSYDVDGHRVTLMIFNPNSTRIVGGQAVRLGDKDVRVGRQNGYNVAIWLRGDVAYALSSDLPRKQLLALMADI